MNKKNGLRILFLMGIVILGSLLVASASASLGIQANFPQLHISPLINRFQHEQNTYGYNNTHGCNVCNNLSPVAYVPQKHPIMSKESWTQRNEAIENLPKVGINPELRAGVYPSSFSLLGYIPSYSDRDQGQCGNCWVWGCTAPIEVAHYVQNGVPDRLSIQILNSNYNGGSGSHWACCGGSELLFQNFYSAQGKFIPWSNSNADFRDGARSCSMGTSVPASSISTTPNYPITFIQWHEIQTAGVGTDQAISNIKSYLYAKKAVTLGFYLPDFTPFWDFWDANSGNWDPGQYCGKPDGAYPGGHEVTVVGWDDTSNSWIVLNSWGTDTAHPDGTFKMKMDMNYDCANGGSYSYDFGYFDVTFTNQITAPTVANGIGATLITTNSARLNGEVTNTGGERPTVHIYWGTQDGGTNPANWGHDENLGVKPEGAFYKDISGLTPNTPYYYRCLAINSGGSSWAASTTSFVTPNLAKLIGADEMACSNPAPGGYFCLARFQAVGTGNVNTLKVKTSGTGNVKVAIYADSSGTPGNLLNKLDSGSPVIAGWNSISIPPTAVIKDNYYWLAFESDNSIVCYSKSSGLFYYKAAPYASFSFPSTAGSGFYYSTAVTALIAGWNVAPIAPK